MPTITGLRLWTIPDAASEVLDVHPETLRRWIKAGRLEAVHLTPGTVRIREDELVRFIDGAKR